MKLTTREVVDLAAAITNFPQGVASPVGAYRMAVNHKRVFHVVEAYNAERNKWIEELGTKNPETGAVELSPKNLENFREFQRRDNELLGAEVEVTLDKAAMERVFTGEKTVSVQIVHGLLPMLEVTDEKA